MLAATQEDRRGVFDACADVGAVVEAAEPVRVQKPPTHDGLPDPIVRKSNAHAGQSSTPMATGLPQRGQGRCDWLAWRRSKRTTSTTT